MSTKFTMINGIGFHYTISSTLPLTVEVKDDKQENIVLELIEDITGEYIETYIDCEYQHTSEHINNYQTIDDIVIWAINITLFN